MVTNTGSIVYPDRLLMLFAQDVLARNPGAEIIFDVKCTRRLTPLIEQHGGRALMWKTGHSLIKKKMKQTGSLLAGEMSGHIFIKERWYGFDDGIYSAARLLEILSKAGQSAENLFAAFPNDISTPEINIDVTDEGKFSIIDALQRDADWGEASPTTIDGVRVDYTHGWGLVRAPTPPRCWCCASRPTATPNCNVSRMYSVPSCCGLSLSCNCRSDRLSVPYRSPA